MKLIDVFSRIDELSKLNYSLDVELQKERESREQMQAKLRLSGTPKQGGPAAASTSRHSEDRDS